MSPWVTLNTLLEKKYLSYIDLALAEEILKNPSKENEAEASLLCHLSAACRQGHLCLSVSKEGIVPPLLNLWEGNKDEAKEHSTNDLREIEELKRCIESLIVRGIKDLSPNIVSRLSLSESNPKSLQALMGQAGNKLYFQRYWYYETLFLHHFQRLSNSLPSLEFDESLIQNKVKELQNQNKLLYEQADAIVKSSQDAFTIIHGGPGTGKTYTAGLLVNILFESLPEDKQKTFEVALAAPTGKAAANLQKSMLKAIQGVTGKTQLQSKTLHALLGLKGSEIPAEPLLPLSADLVIVDESSMIDVRLMAFLFSVIKPGARLILLGDPLQLPAVESGSLFADMIKVSKYTEKNSAIELKTCLRAELKGIVDFAEAIKAGDFNACLELLNAPINDKGVHRLIFDQAEAKAICAYALPFYQSHSTSTESHASQLKQFDRFRILSPFRKGPYGVESINNKIYKELCKSHPTKKPFMAPIMLVRNDPRMDLFNGETGVLVCTSPTANALSEGLVIGDYALFPEREDGQGVRKIPALLLPAFEYAYCLSVHKSQGSEFEHVLLLLPEGSEIFGREVLYTAVTRTRKRLDIWDQPGALEKTIAKQSYRYSGVVERLQSSTWAAARA